MSLTEKSAFKENQNPNTSDSQCDMCANGDSNGTELTEILPDPQTDMPSRFWRQSEKHQRYQELRPLDIKTPVHPDRIRFVCLSDTHAKLKPVEAKKSKTDYFIPNGDILLHAGDFTMKGRPLEIEHFNSYLGQLPHKKKIVIAGNHDLPFDENTFTEENCFEVSAAAVKRHLGSKGLKSARDLITNAIYLQDSMVTVCGINIYGSPWQPKYCDWAFNADRGVEILQKWNCIPEDVDILITHGPPVGHGDVTKSGIHVGCVELLNTVQKRVKPKFHVFGHIHEGYGVSTDGVTTFINAAACTTGYKLHNPPIIFDVPLPPGQSKDSLLDNLDIVSCAIKDLPQKSKTLSITKEDRQKKTNLLLQLKKTKLKSE